MLVALIPFTGVVATISFAISMAMARFSASSFISLRQCLWYFGHGVGLSCNLLCLRILAILHQYHSGFERSVRMGRPEGIVCLSSPWWRVLTGLDRLILSTRSFRVAVCSDQRILLETVGAWTGKVTLCPPWSWHDFTGAKNRNG